MVRQGSGQCPCSGTRVQLNSMQFLMQLTDDYSISSALWAERALRTRIAWMYASKLRIDRR